MRHSRFLIALILPLLLLSAGTRPVTIHMIGDSTMAEKSEGAGRERGWGMVLQGFFDNEVDVKNYAVNGRSSRSFILEGRWQQVLDAIKPGDYVVIQFGHNDEKGYTGDKRHAVPGLTFDDNLRLFVKQAKAHGATPIVMNAVARRNFFNAGLTKVDDESLRTVAYKEEKVNSDTVLDTHGRYRDTPRNVALMERVPYVDANTITTQMENEYGVERSRTLHMWLKPGEDGVAKGRQDNTHYNIQGAHEVASRLVRAMAQACPELRPHVRVYDYIVSAERRGNYPTLQAAIDAAPRGKLTQIYVIDGTWPKPDTKRKKVKIIYRQSLH